jgi:acyl-CoA reductase-like NAD-dependent aldehyde dehydrogenase
MYVHQTLYNEFVERFVSRTKQLVIGSPLDEETNITAIISKKSLERLHNWLDEAVQQGAQIECGGKSDGPVFFPTVLTNAKPDTRVVSQEVFGPIVVIDSFTTLDEAIKKVNDSRYGLNAGIFTPRIDRAFHAAQEIETGGVIINDTPTFRVDHMPYGGLKDSGIGREGIRYAVEQMTEQKFISFKL